MAMSRSLRSGRQGQRVLALVAFVGFVGFAASTAFVGSTAQTRGLRSGTLGARAEGAAAPAPAPTPSTSTALVKVTEENQVTTASVVPGLIGLLVGGVWVGGALFAAGAYLSRRKDDVGLGLRGIAGGSLEVLNFGGYVNEKYEVSNKIGSAFSDAVKKADGEGSSSSVGNAVNTISESVSSFDQEVGIKDTLGSFFTSASDLANQAVEKAIELDGQYKVSEQLAAKINESINSAKASSETEKK